MRNQKMNDYKAVYKNTGLTPRSLNEAYKNAEYATPIYRQVNTEVRDALEFMGGLLVGLTYIGLGSSIAVAILVFFGVVVIK